MLRNFLQDARFAARSLARRPLFTGVILLTLGLGIGSVVAIFSVAHAVLLRPLPFTNPEELAFIWTRLPATNVARSLVSGPDLKDLQQQATRFEGFAGAMAIPGTLTGEGKPERITNAYVTWNLFQLLGVTPALGRLPVAEDAITIDPKVFGTANPELPPGTVMLTHELWQNRFAGDRSVIGRTIQMDGFGSVVVGVLPPNFKVYLPPDAGMPTDIDAFGVLPANIGDFARDAPWLTVVTRLKDGVTLEQAQAEMDGIAERLQEVHQFHKTQNLQITVAGMHRDVVNHARPAIVALLGAVAFVLLIACANIANLLLVRGSERHREIALRAAVGSGRGRIVGQLMTESLLLGFAGAVIGVLLASQGIGIIRWLSPSTLPFIENVRIDGVALAFTAGVSILAAVAFGLTPALRAVGGQLADALRDRGSGSGGMRGNKLRSGLVVAEVALSFVLLIGAGLLVRSFAKLQQVDPGFDARNAVTFNAPVSFLKYFTTQARTTFVNRLIDELATVPGVELVGGVAPLPLAGGDQYSVASYGRIGESDDAYRANKADFKSVLPGYFEAMRIKLVSGRTFVRADNEIAALDVAIIDVKLAKRVFGDADPVGSQLMVDHFNEATFSLERLPVTIVGVVQNVRSASLAAEGRETVYVPYAFSSFLPPTFVVRTTVDPTSLIASIRGKVTAIDPDVPVAELATLESWVDKAMAQSRFLLVLSATFAVLALVLASLGLYGVLSYTVRQRTREVGVRLALGANGDDMMRLMLGQGMILSSIGLVLGLAGSFALTRVVSAYLVGVTATDAVTFVLVPALLLLVAAVACYVPARRASRIEPSVALREE